MDPRAPDDELNPYAPPASDFNAAAPVVPHQALLAEHGTRLGAALIDWALAYVPVLVLAVVLAVLYSDSSYESVLLPILLGLAWWLGFSIFQWYRVATTGQSLGKKWTGIMIVRVDGSPVNFGSGVGMRSWLPGFISGIPYLGFLFWLTDVLMIFRESRQCLHDEMAGTKVIVVRPQ